MTRSIFLWALSVALLSTEKGVAQERIQLLGTAERGVTSVSQILSLRGCHPDWLAQALSDSRIGEASAWRLAPGQRIYLGVGLCKEEPPREQARLSHTIMESRPARSRPSAPVPAQAELARLQARVPELEKEITGLKEMVGNLEGKLKEASDRASRAEARASALEASSPPRASQTNWWVVLLSGLVGAGLGVIATSAVKRRRARIRESRATARVTSEVDPSLKN